MPGYLLPIPLQFFDNNGDPLNGGSVDTYAGGTSTPLATYDDPGLTVENTNPVILDSAGRARIFVADGVSYKVVIKDANGVTIRTEDLLQVPQIDAPAVAAEVPTGALIMFGGEAAPAGYLLCDGSQVSRTTYADLFNAIGTHFGTGNGSTTFHLPDLRQRYPMGVAVSGTGNALGGTFGTIDHVHTGPSHFHTVAAHDHTMAHTHTVYRDGWGSANAAPPVAGRLQAGGSGEGSEMTVQQATADNTTGGSSAASTGTKSLQTEPGGTGNTGGANPPTLVVNFIIKT